MRQAVAARGPVDLLIANAGTATAVPFAKATPDQFRDMFELHVLGMLHPVQAVLGGMIERGFGRIVAVASIVGLRASPNVSPYTTAKHAMVGLMRSVALETAGSGVTVNAVCPGYVDTELIRGPLDRLVEKGTNKRGGAGAVHVAGAGRPAGAARGGRGGGALFLFAGSGGDHGRHPGDRSGWSMMDERTSIPLDAETKVSERPDDHKTELRLWLRLLTCTTLIENEVRRRLRDQFDITLPRFDLLAQLDRAPNGMTLGELSQRMMVSNGNITGLVERLAEQGLIRRRPLPNDRRVQIVSLTPEGQKFFRSMARINADWVGEIFAGLSPKDIEALMPLLAKTKQSARKALRTETRHERGQSRDAAAVRLPGPPCRFCRGRQGRDADAEPARQEEPADLRQLRRDRRSVPRRREGQGRQGHRRDWQPAATSAPAATCSRSSSR